MANVLGALFQDIAKEIRGKTGAPETDRMAPAEFPERIKNIPAGGGGTDPNVHYVTFMANDGVTVLYKRPVADGDNCADVVARGLLETPTKESTVQTVYTHSGWASSAGGSAISDILNAVVADKTVYAAFTASTRYYTVTWLDDDGSVLKTESLAYGATPFYVPEKSGYGFDGWIPAVSAVTEDVTYTASWTTKVSFANAAWVDIARVAETGKARDHFSIGDERIIPVTFNGETKNYKARIVGFNHDVCDEDETVVCGISVMFFTVPSTKYKWKDSAVTTTDRYYTSNLYTVANQFYAGMPEELKAVLKSARKSYNKCGTTTMSYGTYKLWVPSTTELYSTPLTQFAECGKTYEAFATTYSTYYGNTNKTKTKVVNTSGATALLSTGFWCRNAATNANGGYSRPAALINTGTGVGPSISPTFYNETREMYVPFGFCI